VVAREEKRAGENGTAGGRAQGYPEEAAALIRVSSEGGVSSEGEGGFQMVARSDTAGKENAARPRLLFRILEGYLMAVFHATRFLFRLLPPSFMYAVFRFLGSAFYYARPGMRRRLEDRIAQAMPELRHGKAISGIAREVCASLFMPMADIFTMERHGERYLRELRVEGEENLARAESGGKGIIFVTPHQGGVAVIHAVLARMGKPYTPIMYNPGETSTPRYVEAMAFHAGLLGCDTEEPVFWASRDIIPRVREHLLKGKSIGLTFDVPGGGVVRFFGRPAAFAGGTGHFAYETGAPIVPFALLRGKGPFDNRLIFRPPIFCDTSAERESEVLRVMGEVVAAEESFIREAPGHWMSWFGLWSWWEQAQEILRKTG
jgi:lauroyl/myristoyl acyltransferase